MPAKENLNLIVGALVTLLGVIATVSGIYTFRENHPSFDLTGEWAITDKIESTSYRPYQGLELEFRVYLNQQGRVVRGSGEKWSQNGKWLPVTLRSHITVKDGKITGNRVRVVFEEAGVKRSSSGSFDWTYEKKTDSLNGTFASTSAEAHGSSLGTGKSGKSGTDETLYELFCPFLPTRFGACRNAF